MLGYSSLRCVAGTSIWSRGYAISRFPNKRVVGRSRNAPSPVITRKADNEPVQPHEQTPSAEQSELWKSAIIDSSGGSRQRLEHLLMGPGMLMVERQLEMLNIFIGYEQCNKYSISNEAGEPLGYVAEEPGRIYSNIARQVLGTHRPFRALVMGLDGSPLMWLRRPFSWINSKMYVQRQTLSNDTTPEGEPVLETFAEVQQVWHPIRRKYDLFIRKDSERILSTPSEPQPTPDASVFSQLAYVDAPFLSWDFQVLDERGDELAFITRTFRGFGREILTDTGLYGIRFGSPSPEQGKDARKPVIHRQLSLDERALVLALAINIDADYFSRHSNTPGTGLGLLALEI